MHAPAVSVTPVKAGYTGPQQTSKWQGGKREDGPLMFCWCISIKPANAWPFVCFHVHMPVVKTNWEILFLYFSWKGRMSEGRFTHLLCITKYHSKEIYALEWNTMRSNNA